MIESVTASIIFVIITTHLSILSVTIYLHRGVTHLCFKHMNKGLEHFFRFWLWLTTGMSTKEWVAVHRMHHKEVEKEGDPHSPVIQGIWTILFGGALIYRKNAKRCVETLEKIDGLKGVPNDLIAKMIYEHRIIRNLGVFLLLFIFLLVFENFSYAIIAWIVQILWIPFFAAGVINGVGHYAGYRNYNLDNNSKNIIPMGVFIGGEELHNNHHKNPSNSKFSHKWWEFDLGWLFIKFFSVVRLIQLR